MGERCRYTSETREFPELGSACCWRPVWGDRDRCIWHADVRRKPVGELRAATIANGERLDGAIMRDTVLDDLGTLSGAVLVNADLSNASAEHADFSDADLRNATFDDASLRDACLRRANLEDAVLKDTDLKGANFVDARIHETDFTRSYIGQDTVFGDTVVYEEEFEDADSEHARREAFDAATWSYRTLQYWSRENSLTDRTEAYFIREKDLRRRFAWAEKDYYHALRAEGSRYLIGYGYRIRGILVASLLVLLASTALFPLLGGINESFPEGSVTYALDQPLQHPVEDLLTVYAKSFYLSLESFTTLGIGDVTPGSFASQLLAGVEALVGYVLLALLISVLARRRYWL